MKLFEIDRPRPTRTKTRHPSLDQATFDLPNVEVGPTSNLPSQRTQTHTPSLKQAGRAQTHNKMRGVNMPAGAGEKMSFVQHLGLQDKISDEEAAQRAGYNIGVEEVPTPSEPNTLPAEINKLPARMSQEIAKQKGITPEWHKVKNLPGYLQAGIRAIGRQVFGTFTSTPIEDIQVIASLGGGPNSDRELNAVAGWLTQNGTRDTDGEMDFQKTIPEYGAQFSLWKTDEQSFLLVTDFAGKYVYSWPTSDEVNNAQSTRRPMGAPPRRLR